MARTREATRQNAGAVAGRPPAACSEDTTAAPQSRASATRAQHAQRAMAAPFQQARGHNTERSAPRLAGRRQTRFPMRASRCAHSHPEPHGSPHTSCCSWQPSCPAHHTFACCAKSLSCFPPQLQPPRPFPSSEFSPGPRPRSSLARLLARAPLHPHALTRRAFARQCTPALASCAQTGTLKPRPCGAHGRTKCLRNEYVRWRIQNRWPVASNIVVSRIVLSRFPTPV